MKIWGLLIPLLAFGCQPPVDPQTPVLERAKSSIKDDPLSNLPYALGERHNLDLYLPTGQKHEPLLIFIHGGAWIGGDKGLYKTLGHYFSAQGLAVAIVNYRLSPGVQNPEHVKDASLAYAWLVQNAGKYGFDPKKIFVSGHSAGAHNAGMMATGPFLSDAKVPAADMPAGFIGLEGIYDIPDLNTKFPSYKDWFFTKAFGAESGWAEGSPSRRKVELRAPWLIVQSTTDTLVNVSQADKFAAHLGQAGVKVQVIGKDLGQHDAVIQNMNDPDNDLSAKVLKFVRG